MRSMTEKEKAASGEPYNANYDRELVEERARCKSICFEYNHTPPSNGERRNAIISKLFGKVGNNFLVEQPFYCDYGYNIEIGENLFINYNCVILDGAKVTFGDNVFIGPGCGFYTVEHPLDVVQRNEGLEYAYSIAVGNNVWIGAQVVVLSGVTIGENTVIGAGSVVTKDIPANVIAAGNPCRILRRRKPLHSPMGL
ncbi:sugar O-acetyltransferase [Bacteroidaceae bacterium HV4-6-C5C]|nr:sugar O-acetyltransferase [Bacteroidaceae bacterium HV4-6-C5C]